MAGMKETPRQKMIGMMYLVLTALLALQVSDALLQKFVLLNNSLETANTSSQSSSDGAFLSFLPCCYVLIGFLIGLSFILWG